MWVWFEAVRERKKNHLIDYQYTCEPVCSKWCNNSLKTTLRLQFFPWKKSSCSKCLQKIVKFLWKKKQEIGCLPRPRKKIIFWSFLHFFSLHKIRIKMLLLVVFFSYFEICHEKSRAKIQNIEVNTINHNNLTPILIHVIFFERLKMCQFFRVSLCFSCELLSSFLKTCFIRLLYVSIRWWTKK